MTEPIPAERRPRRGRRGARTQRKGVHQSWPLALLTALLVVLTLPGVFLVAPGFVGPEPPPPPPPAPAWHQVPATLPPVQGLATLDASANIPLQAAVTRELDALLMADGGGSFAGMVQDGLTGEVLFDREGSGYRVPASNLKLLTAVAALRSLGPEHRFGTRVLAGPVAGQIVLQGGGDVLLGPGESDRNRVLGHAGLATLANETARALAGTAGEIKVLVDDTLFTGPALNPAWEAGDVAAGEVAPVYPMALNSARPDPAAATGSRPQDSSLTVATEFTNRLREAGAAAGLAVAAGVERLPGGSGLATTAPEMIAEVQSATVADQVNLMLLESDNYLAEALGRMAALAAGQPATHEGAAATVVAQLAGAGIPVDGMRLADVCGLAMGNQVSPRQLVEVVRAITSGTDARLRAAVGGLSVAGLTGTLGNRFTDPATSGGAGLVRAKTGTLNTVLALTGYTVNADGRLLAFSFIGNGLRAGAAGNRLALDQAATALAACGCR